MQQLNDGLRFTTDHVDVKRTAFLVEPEDVGNTIGQYLGQHDYTFEQKDVGRLVEIVQEFSPGYMSWGFGSIFAELNQQHPNTHPYIRLSD